MPTFFNRLPKEDEKYAYTLVRTPTDGTIAAVITSDDLLGCYTHWYGGHTVPCERPTPDQEAAGIENICRACADQSPARFHAYLSAFALKTGTHFLFECTLKAAAAFESYRDSYGTLRGCYFTATRPKRRKNSGISVIVKPADLSKIKIPPGLDIPKALAVIWQLPGAAVATPTHQNGTPIVGLAQPVLDRMNGRTPSTNGRKTKCHDAHD